MLRAWLLLTIVGSVGCYAVPATHEVEPQPGDGGADATESEDAEPAQDDGGTGLVDAGKDGGSPMDGSLADRVMPMDSSPDALPADGAADASRCSCSDLSKPACMEDTGICVECQNDLQCTNGKHCLASIGQCVGCTEQAHCAATPNTGYCDPTEHKCVPCHDGVDSECASVPGLKVCAAGKCVQCTQAKYSACGEDAPYCNPRNNKCEACVGDGDCARFQKVCDEVVGACVGCTIDSEAAQCAGKSCNPATKACTQTALKSVDECHKCTADSECLDANHRCVAMNYQGTARGGYCLRRQSAVCTRPYGTETTRGSLSGAPIETYCGVDELVTSCEAVLALLMDKGCPSGQASQCEAPGAICGTVGGFPQRCSYGCEASRSCPDVLDLACPTSGNNKFCGK